MHLFATVPHRTWLANFLGKELKEKRKSVCVCVRTETEKERERERERRDCDFQVISGKD